MAIFNPETSVNLGDNYTTRSQGQTPNKALGYLFSGLADSVSAWKKGQKEKEDNAIANAAQVGVDTIAGSEGDIDFSPATPDRIFRQPGDRDGRPADLLESETSPLMQAAETKLQRLKAARDQNSGMSDLYFSQQVAVLTKRLNTQFPGEEAKVAAMVERALGTSSANRVRKEQLAILNAEGSAADTEDKRKKQILKEAANAGHLGDPYIMTRYEKMAGVAFNPEDFNENAWLAAVSERTAEDAADARFLQKAKVKAEGSKEREELFKKGVTQQVLTLADRLLYTNLNQKQDIRGLDEPQTSVDFRNVRQMIAEQLAGGQPITPKQVLAIRNQLNQLNVQMNSAYDQLLNSYATEIPDAKDRDAIKKMGMAPLDTMIAAFAGPNPDLGIIGATKAAVEAQDNAFELSQGPYNKRLSQAIDALGKENVNKLLMKNISGQLFADPAEEAVFNSLKLYLAGGQSLTDLLKTAKKDGTLTQEQVSKLVAPAISQYVETILTSDDPKVVQKAARSLFNEDERKLILNNGKSNPDALLRLLASPEMTEKLKGTPEWDNYSDFVKFQARPMFKQWAETALDTQVNTGSGKISWNETAHRFQYELDESGLPSGIGPGPEMFRDWDVYQADKGRRAVESINQYLDILDPIFKTDGDSAEGFLQGFFGSQSFKEMKKNGSLLDRMNKGLEDWNKKQKEKMLKDDPGIENFDIDQQKNSPLGTQPGGTSENRIDPTGDIMAAPNLIAEFEGFREKPYWDVNAWRVGFGSDTLVGPDGKAQRVTRNTKVTKEQAMMDLFNRVGSFETELVEDLGSDTWNGLNAKQRAALTSVAYNYGSIPKVLASAVKSGDKGKVQAAFAKLAEHNEGINKKRRMKELRVFLGMMDE